MSDTIARADQLYAELRDLCIPWKAGYELAHHWAVEAVMGMRNAFNEFAEKDPYETGKPERWNLSAEAVEKEPVVQAMTMTFLRILNRQGLLKIDP
jgi:hypothetical protein